ncbi:hypothetical protein AVEN_134590-1 [Araneus ventricosus]|uniref:Uncharacterized protein n=1 Tax=Araneus ventricosus TaxID=182803 RepID=A0A4Y2T0V8_ARAVE|nr:hypothetical protein AVEN_134590-1 [Araneus ventricosus]
MKKYVYKANKLLKIFVENPLIPKATEINLKIRQRPNSSIKDKGNSFSLSKTTMTAGIVRIIRKPPSSPNTSGRATLTKKALAAGVTFGRLSSYARRDEWDDPASM